MLATTERFHGLSATDPAQLLEAVLEANASTTNPRLREILESFITHLHAFALEVDLSPAELDTGLDFLVRLGQASGPAKHEGILLADILGLATLVQLRGARDALAHGGTEPALVGPFWRARQPMFENGANIATPDTPGEPLSVHGRVCSLDGQPLAGARVETWQASPKGLYENQDPEQDDMNLRGVFMTDAQGHFDFRSVRPSGYPVPVDGPCGELLAAQGRNIMRPAHLHVLVVAPGHRVLATQFFDAEDPQTQDDVVFGTVGSLLREFEPDGKGGWRLQLELRLAPGETILPHCPLP